MLNTEQAKAALDMALQDMCREFNSGAFTPILEADVAAYIYHRLLVNGCAPNGVYLSTRICGDAARTRKPDLVIGTLHVESACTITSAIKGPCGLATATDCAPPATAPIQATSSTSPGGKTSLPNPKSERGPPPLLS